MLGSRRRLVQAAESTLSDVRELAGSLDRTARLVAVAAFLVALVAVSALVLASRRQS